jgi:ribosomal protein S18 acetylase RimI-like enzyme
MSNGAAVEIRAAQPEDAGRIAEIHVRSWQHAYLGLIPQDYLDALDPAQRRGMWDRSLETADWSRGGTLVIMAGGRLAGFAHVHEARDADAAPSVGEIWAIYLEPEAWGKGLGRELMAAALRALAEIGYDEATLWVLDSNVRARRFYEAAGFTPDGAVQDDDARGFRIHEVRYRRMLR